MKRVSVNWNENLGDVGIYRCENGTDEERIWYCKQVLGNAYIGKNHKQVIGGEVDYRAAILVSARGDRDRKFVVERKRGREIDYEETVAYLRRIS